VWHRRHVTSRLSSPVPYALFCLDSCVRYKGTSPRFGMELPGEEKEPGIPLSDTQALSLCGFTAAVGKLCTLDDIPFVNKNLRGYRSSLVFRFEEKTCGKTRLQRGQACAPGGGNGLPQPGQCVANRIPQWAQNCQCASSSLRHSRHSWTKWRNSSWSFRSAASSRLSSDDGCGCSSSMVSLPFFLGVGHSLEHYSCASCPPDMRRRCGIQRAWHSQCLHC
jgi:hypothetical protein